MFLSEWTAIRDFRNFVVHEYFEINYDIIWQTATMMLTDLKKGLQQ